MLKELILQQAKQASEFGIKARRHLHQYPELSFEEYETSRFVLEQLQNMGIPCQLIANTGVVGLIEGEQPASRIIALRADMDALAIEEQNQVSYKSKRPGVMHACGHDVHTAVLLGAAQVLYNTKQHWKGTIKLIFQPGEEKNPGGASIMIEAGVLQNPEPEAIVALHVHPGLPVGRFSFRSGTVMASADELYLTVRSNGGHAAAPHLTRDTIAASAEIILSIQQIISRNNNPFNPSVLSICSIQGGNTTNVIPHEVKMKGTLRCMDEDWRFKAHQLLQNQIAHIGQALEVETDLYIDKGYPMVYNNPALNQQAVNLALELVGTEKVEETEMRMGAEDFGYYAQKVPACFFRLGVQNKEKNINSGVHTPTFDIDEDAIENGISMMAWIATQLRGPNTK